MLLRPPLHSPLRSPLHGPTESKWGLTLAELLATAGTDLLNWWDFSDTLYQEDTAETVTGDTEDIGFVPDKASMVPQRFLPFVASQPELVINHSFAGSISPWIDNTQGTGSAVWSEGKVTLSGTDTSNRGVVCSDPITCVVGRQYHYKLLLSDMSGTPGLRTGADINQTFGGTIDPIAHADVDGIVSGRFIATSTTMYVLAYTFGSGSVSIEYFSTKEVPGSHATEATNQSTWHAASGGDPAYAHISGANILTADAVTSSDASQFWYGRINNTDSKGVLWAVAAGALYVGAYEISSSSTDLAGGAIGGTFWVDGAQVTTRAEFYDALSDEEDHVVEHRNGDYSTTTASVLNGYQSGGWECDIRLNQNFFIASGSWLTANRSQLESLLSE